MKKIHSIVGIETTITPPITKAMTMYELDLVGLLSHPYLQYTLSFDSSLRNSQRIPLKS